MIKVVVGLGNPGRQYEQNRHNVGFLFVDKLANDFSVTWVRDTKFQGWITEISIDNNKLLLFKADTFMNLSGQAVCKVARYYKILPNELLVVHDELDFSVGVVKLKKAGGHAGHNGLRDIIAHLSSADFYRLRIGIGRPSNNKSVADFVLSNPNHQEQQLLMNAFENCSIYFSDMINGNINIAMNSLNSLG